MDNPVILNKSFDKSLHDRLRNLAATFRTEISDICAYTLYSDINRELWISLSRELALELTREIEMEIKNK